MSHLPRCQWIRHQFALGGLTSLEEETTIQRIENVRRPVASEVDNVVMFQLTQRLPSFLLFLVSTVEGLG